MFDITKYMSFWYDVVPLSIATALTAIAIVLDMVRKKR